MRQWRRVAVAGACGALSSLALAQHAPLLRFDPSVFLDDCLSLDRRPSCGFWSPAEDEARPSASAALLPPEHDLPPRRQIVRLDYEPARHPSWDEEIGEIGGRGGANR